MWGAVSGMGFSEESRKTGMLPPMRSLWKSSPSFRSQWIPALSTGRLPCWFRPMRWREGFEALKSRLTGLTGNIRITAIRMRFLLQALSGRIWQGGILPSMPWPIIWKEGLLILFPDRRIWKRKLSGQWEEPKTAFGKMRFE